MPICVWSWPNRATRRAALSCWWAARRTRIAIIPCLGNGKYKIRCIVSGACGSAGSDEATYSVCYANCDCSEAPPVLNVSDFICFLNTYAAWDPAANCDGSTTHPLLNVADFICFQSKFAAGCP